MNDQLREEVRQHYAAAATRNGGCCGFDSTTGVMSLGSGDPLAAADLQPGERVLDLGSGAGPDVIRAAEQVGSDGIVWGLDMTDEMLALARRNVADVGLRNAHFLKGEIESVPLPAESVDVVISNCVINLSTDKPAVFEELARVLAPGGRVAVSDIVAEDRLAPEERAERGSYCGCIAGALSKGEYEQLLVGAGLEDVSVEFTREPAEGMHAAVIRARKPAEEALPEPTTASPVAAAAGCCDSC
jgi:arsenite methyltransferase